MVSRTLLLYTGSLTDILSHLWPHLCCCMSANKQAEQTRGGGQCFCLRNKLSSGEDTVGSQTLCVLCVLYVCRWSPWLSGSCGSCGPPTWATMCLPPTASVSDAIRLIADAACMSLVHVAACQPPGLSKLVLTH